MREAARSVCERDGGSRNITVALACHIHHPVWSRGKVRTARAVFGQTGKSWTNRRKQKDSRLHLRASVPAYPSSCVEQRYGKDSQGSI